MKKERLDLIKRVDKQIKEALALEKENKLLKQQILDAEKKLRELEAKLKIN